MNTITKYLKKELGFNESKHPRPTQQQLSQRESIQRQSAESSFSVSNLTKNYLRSTISETRLNGLVLMYIYPKDTAGFMHKSATPYFLFSIWQKDRAWNSAYFCIFSFNFYWRKKNFTGTLFLGWWVFYGLSNRSIVYTFFFFFNIFIKANSIDRCSFSRSTKMYILLSNCIVWKALKLDEYDHLCALCKILHTFVTRFWI